MDKPFMEKILENIFLVASDPVSLAQLYETLNIASQEGRQALDDALMRLKKEYANRGLQLMEVGGGYQLTTQASYARWIGRYKKSAPIQISEEAKISLAIIAYKQPIKRGEIEEIRGVECESVLQTLRQLDLIQVVGELSGAYLYGTTKKFLRHFNLNQLSELPPLGSPMKTDVPKQ